MEQPLRTQSTNPFAPKVLGTWKQRPPAVKVKRRKLVPLARPTPSQVLAIVRYERDLWGGPDPLNRIWCESRYEWDAKNGDYEGLLQFGPIWSSMWPGTPRQVVKTSSRTKRVRSKVKTVYTSGKVRTRNGPKVRQRVVTIRRGMIPADASPYHGWAAVRVHQRAISGHGPSTGWECPL